MKDIIAEVRSVELVNHNVYQVILNVDEANFIAGQYLMISLPTGEKVPYSIGSAPYDLPELTLYILKSDTDSLAHKVIEHIRHNNTIVIKMPGGDCHLESPSFKQSTLKAQTKHILLIAGGTGFAQMKSIYDSLTQENYQGHVSLYWGVRTTNDIFMADWIKQAQQTHTFTLDTVVNDAEKSWQGKTGWLYDAILADHPDLSNSVAFISGSVNMVYGTLDQLEANGLNKEHCFSDVFAYAPNPKKTAP